MKAISGDECLITQTLSHGGVSGLIHTAVSEELGFTATGHEEHDNYAQCRWTNKIPNYSEHARLTVCSFSFYPSIIFHKNVTE